MKLLPVKFFGLFVFIAIVVSYFFFTFQPAGDSNKDKNKYSSSESMNQGLISDKNKRIENSFEDRLVHKLKTLYGKTIGDKSTQVLLLKTKRYLLTKYPEDGDTIFYSILKRAFPKYADEILKTLAALESYLQWEEQNKTLLSQMNTIEKQGLIWEKRKELFGIDAEEIWTKEIESYEKRKRDMQGMISRLDQSTDSTIYEKLDDYQQSLNTVYKNTPEAYILQSKDLLAKVFISLNSVQHELKEMTAEERKLELNNIRSEMGYSQAQIERLEAIDDKKNSRWDNGLTYMAERDELSQTLEGTEFDTALKTLREKYFKHEAKTIQLEEEDGFFRYTRKRIYGKN